MTLRVNKPRTLNIRRTTLADIDVLAPLFDAYRQFYAQAADLERARQYLQDRLQTDQAVIFLAELENKGAGFCLLYPSFSSVNTARTFLLNDLFTSHAARRQGVGLALLAAAVDYARKENVVSISLETASDNLAAQALYRRAGWSQADSCWFYQSIH